MIAEVHYQQNPFDALYQYFYQSHNENNPDDDSEDTGSLPSPSDSEDADPFTFEPSPISSPELPVHDTPNVNQMNRIEL